MKSCRNCKYYCIEAYELDDKEYFCNMYGIYIYEEEFEEAETCYDYICRQEL